MSYKSFFHVLIEMVEHDRERFDRDLNKEIPPVCLGLGLFMWSIESPVAAAVGMLVFAGFLHQWKSPLAWFEAMGRGSPIDRKYHALVIGHCFPVRKALRLDWATITLLFFMAGFLRVILMFGLSHIR